MSLENSQFGFSAYHLIFAEHFLISSLFIIHVWIFPDDTVIPWDQHVFGLPLLRHPNPS